MRRLLYVPIIHTDPDLGSLAEGIEAQAKLVVGASRWQKHKETVHLYWQQIAACCAQVPASGLKIFQDGLPIDGPAGENLVKDLANQGSVNHEIIAHLLERGAELVDTEDPTLLKEEYTLTRELMQSKSNKDGPQALSLYRWRKDRLLKARDIYISRRINARLVEGETGICFLGAYHRIFPYVAKDIALIPLKDPAQVSAYYQKLTSSRGADEVEKLASYLTTPINLQSGEHHD